MPDTLVRWASVSLAPAPLRFRRGPLLVLLEVWSDGTHQARWPEAVLHGEGLTEEEALTSLRACIGDFVQEMREGEARGDVLGGRLQTRWEVVQAAVETGEAR